MNMSENETEKEKFFKLIDEDQSLIQGVTSSIKDLNNSILSLDLRHKENNALKNALSFVPDDVAEELIPKIIGPYEQAHQDLLKSDTTLRSLGPIHGSTDGSSSAFLSIVNTTIGDEEKEESWHKKFDSEFEKLAEENLQKELIISSLSRINPYLADLFSQAIDTYKKADLRFLGLDVAAIRMRDFVEKLWGEFVDIARMKDTSNQLKNRFELRVDNDRKKIANLIALPNKHLQCSNHLDNLQKLHQKLSPPAKDPNFENFLMLKNLYTEMVLLTNALLSCIDI